MNGFARLHPFSIFLFYAAVIMGTVLSMNPVVCILSMTCGIIYRIVLKESGILRELLQYVAVIIMVTIMNMLLSHNGETVLFYINDNRITMDAAVYGIFSGIMIAAVIAWCRSLSTDLTEDKILYLMGNVSSDMALVLSMVMRFIPVYVRQAEKVSETYKVIDKNKEDNIISKIRSALRVYDSVLGYGIENSIDTADSMRARGYGCCRRTMYHRFSMGRTDIIYIALILADIVIYGVCMKNNIVSYSFYPTMDILGVGIKYMFFYVSFGTLVAVPLIEELKERIKWKFLISGI